MMHLDFCDPAVKLHWNIELDDLVGGFFQVTPSKSPLFVSFKGIFSKFSYVKPNPYYRLFVNCNVQGVLCYPTYRNLWRCFNFHVPSLSLNKCQQMKVSYFSKYSTICQEIWNIFIPFFNSRTLKLCPKKEILKRK